MRAGKLRERIALQSKSVTRDAIGAEVVEWVTYATVWAGPEPISGRKFFAAAQRHPETTAVFALRFRADVTTEHRLLWRGQPYDIHEALPSANRAELTLACKAGVHDGR